MQDASQRGFDHPHCGRPGIPPHVGRGANLIIQILIIFTARPRLHKSSLLGQAQEETDHLQVNAWLFPVKPVNLLMVFFDSQNLRKRKCARLNNKGQPDSLAGKRSLMGRKKISIKCIKMFTK
jgi:hypothetical protein